MTRSPRTPLLADRVNVASIEQTITEATRPGVAMPPRATVLMHIVALTVDVKTLLREVSRGHPAYQRAQGLVLPRARPGEQTNHYELWQYSLTLARAAQDLLDAAQQEAALHDSQH
ncbi:hypothetical protein [Streptomyces flavofungini]|uniref:Uncharacterized protein n=1 Tax=Streptomyces flavofungini TaxID=68200 RepID=A0ABS0X7P0_9ACTN|nr:hypothetical protein [Streptomyces flavofungini]MBJ3809219.1 hypothetical protein [Streptomyces flavofungini]GHC76979.1 hypothetical protein GCM10010349_57270 [Streptomyces flavofungini]